MESSAEKGIQDKRTRLILNFQGCRQGGSTGHALHGRALGDPLGRKDMLDSRAGSRLHVKKGSRTR
jgi:hypothetical protein